MSIINTPPAGSQAHSFCVVGGGATGSVFLITLARKLKNSLPSGAELHLFDPNGFGHGGTAYGLADDKMILNSIRTEMSPWEPEKFHRYCIKNKLGNDKKSFETRPTYQKFLQEETQSAINTLRKAGLKITIHKSTVLLKKAENGLVNICPPSGKSLTFRAKNILLATGYGPSKYFESHRETPNFIDAIYPPEATIKAIEKNKSGNIITLGSGAALYDILRLLPKDFTGKVTAISPLGQTLGWRNTVLETEEQERKTLKTSLIPPETAAKLANQLKEIFNHAVKNKGFTERQAAFCLTKEIPRLLQNLPVTEAVTFRRKHLSSLFHKCTPVPTSSYKILENLRKQGRFEIICSTPRASDIQAKKSGELTIRLADKTIRGDLVINCAGHDPLNLPVIHTLLAKGLAVKDNIFNVLQTDETGYRLSSSIACIGPATHKSLHGIESFYDAIDDITNQISKAFTAKKTERIALQVPAAVL